MANTSVPAVASSIQEAEATKVQLEADLKQHSADSTAANAAMDMATALRGKDAAAHAAEAARQSADINAVDDAMAAIGKGASGASLQTGTARS